jgi:hypothetical protein
MRMRAVASLASVVCLLLATTELAQKSVTLDPFVGRWKEDVSKRTFAGDPPLVFQKGVKNILVVRGVGGCALGPAGDLRR